MTDITERIDDVSDTELAAVVSSAALFPVFDTEDSERFFQQIKYILEGRAASGWPGENPGADAVIFVLVRYPRRVTQDLNAKRILDLPAHDCPLLGNVFFLSRDASNGCLLPMPCAAPDMLDWLEDHGFNTCTIAYGYRKSQKITIRREGVMGDARQDVIRDKPPAIDVAELLSALSHFQSKELVTPSECGPGIWEKGRAQAYVPSKSPEKAIQRKLKIALSAWFRGQIRAEMEDSTPAGRIDVRLLRAIEHSKGLQYWAIIELKVIKSYRNAKQGKAPTVSIAENVDTIVDGIKQTDSYRSVRELDDGLLEIFDMRKVKDDIMGDSQIKSTLAACKVVPNIRPLYGSAKEARDAGVFS